MTMTPSLMARDVIPRLEGLGYKQRIVHGRRTIVEERLWESLHAEIYYFRGTSYHRGQAYGTQGYLSQPLDNIPNN